VRVSGGMRKHDSEFEALFREEYPVLVGALSVALGPEQAADVVQEAFVRANARWERVRTMDRPGAWVRRVALNMSIDHHRKVRRHRRINPLMVTESRVELAPLDRDLAVALATLPTSQRLAVVLHYLLDMPVAEVACELGIAEGTVKANLHRARSSLRKRLEVVNDG
jgi:RNA polymerase sigma-70 factor, ECF subfamily